MKLHPLSIPYRTANLVLQWAWILIVAAFAIPNVLDGAAAIAGIGAVAIAFLGGAIAWQVAYYRRYEYDLTEDTLDIEAGVLSRRTREIPYGRIQNVSIDRNVVQRALGLAEVRIDTAGGSGSEAHLQFVGHDDARWLQDEVSERKRRERDAERTTARDAERAEAAEPGELDAAEDRAVAGPDREVLFEISPHELSVLGLVSFFDPRALPVLFFLFVPFQGTVQDWVLQDGLTAVGLGLLVLVVLGAYAAVAGVRAIYEVANYYGFQLVRSEDELRYERGLLQKFSGTIPLAKVQALTLGEHVVARAVGYATLGLETAGFSPGESAGSRAAIPIARLERVLEVAGRVEPVELPEFERPPRRARERYAVRYGLVVAALTALGYGLASIGFWIGPWYWPLGLLVAVPLAAHLKWRHLGYALTEDHVVTRHGFWSRTTKVVPYHRVQTVADSQTVFQRRRHLATLHVDIAGSRSLVGDDSKAVDVDAGTAAELRETISDRMHESLAEGRRRSGRRFVDVAPGARDAPAGPGTGDADLAGQD